MNTSFVPQTAPTTPSATGNPSEPRIGAFAGGWRLARASWSTLQLDKELVWFPILSAATMAVFLIIMMAVEFAIAGFQVGHLTDNFSISDWRSFLDAAIALLGLYAIGNYFRGALIASALHRFQGGDPTVRFGLIRARLHWKSLLAFSFVQATLGLLFRVAEDKLPLLGKIGVWLVDIAWQLASLFAVPVIIMNEKEISPLSAVRQSAGIFIKTWGKNFMGGFFLGWYVLIAILLWILFGAVSFALAFALPLSLILTAPLLAIFLLLIISVSSALNGIFIAALYHFATTGESPVQFDKNLIRAAFKPKKKWFV